MSSFEVYEYMRWFKYVSGAGILTEVAVEGFAESDVARMIRFWRGGYDVLEQGASWLACCTILNVAQIWPE